MSRERVSSPAIWSSSATSGTAPKERQQVGGAPGADRPADGSDARIIAHCAVVAHVSRPCGTVPEPKFVPPARVWVPTSSLSRENGWRRRRWWREWGQRRCLMTWRWLLCRRRRRLRWERGRCRGTPRHLTSLGCARLRDRIDPRLAAGHSTRLRGERRRLALARCVDVVNGQALEHPLQVALRDRRQWEIETALVRQSTQIEMGRAVGASCPQGVPRCTGKRLTDRDVVLARRQEQQSLVGQDHSAESRRQQCLFPFGSFPPVQLVGLHQDDLAHRSLPFIDSHPSPSVVIQSSFSRPSAPSDIVTIEHDTCSTTRRSAP